MLRKPGSAVFSSSVMPSGQRIALRIEYDGTPFCGWQAQPQLSTVRTVQEDLESALSVIAGMQVRVHCAGRTDTGVHAVAQWVHFDAPVARGLKDWVLGGNAQLVPAIRIADAHPVSSDFHARHSAQSRVYDYLIANTPTAPALLDRRMLWVRNTLEADAMHLALQALLGERDFTAFRAASCQSTTPMRYVSSASVRRQGDCLRLTLEANAFLHHMVRNIVGSVLEIGVGSRSTDWLGTLLEGKDRTLAGATAKAHGLYLSEVRYPAEFAIPSAPVPMFFPCQTPV